MYNKNYIIKYYIWLSLLQYIEKKNENKLHNTIFIRVLPVTHITCTKVKFCCIFFFFVSHSLIEHARIFALHLYSLYTYCI